MIDKRRSYDVFLSYATADRSIAKKIAQALEARKLNVFPPSSGKFDSIKTWSPVFRDAISESKVFVAILTPEGLHWPDILFHLGAALLWNMPAYVIIDDLKKSDIPKALKHASVYTLQDLPKVVDSIFKETSTTLSADEADTLTSVYRDIGVPADELLSNPDALGKLAKRFNRAARADFEPERLLKELFRLRKTRPLPKVST